MPLQRGGQEGLSEEAMYEQQPKEAEGGGHGESPNSHGYDGFGFERLSQGFKQECCDLTYVFKNLPTTLWRSYYKSENHEGKQGDSSEVIAGARLDRLGRR